MNVGAGRRYNTNYLNGSLAILKPDAKLAGADSRSTLGSQHFANVNAVKRLRFPAIWHGRLRGSCGVSVRSTPICLSPNTSLPGGRLQIRGGSPSNKVNWQSQFSLRVLYDSAIIGMRPASPPKVQLRHATSFVIVWAVSEAPLCPFLSF